jgi:hypothetical protein
MAEDWRWPGHRRGVVLATPSGGRGRDIAVGITTRYGLDGTGIESRRGRDFPHPSRSALGHSQPPIQWVTGLFRE